jgi:hypothetical protein
MYDKETGRLAQYGLTQQAQMQQWQTPIASDSLGEMHQSLAAQKQGWAPRIQDQARILLGEVAHQKNWPTPVADDTGNRQKKYAQGGTPLSMASGNWPTPKAADFDMDKDKARTRMEKRKAQGLSTGGIRNLTVEASQNWPTPVADDTGSRQKKYAQGGTPLSMASGNWPTTDVTEATQHGLPAPQMQTGGSESSENAQTSPRHWSTPVASDSLGEMHQSLKAQKQGWAPRIQDQARILTGNNKKKLNPNFVEWMMGLPIGWTDLRPLTGSKD